MSQFSQKGRQLILRPFHLQPWAVLILDPSSMPHIRSWICFGCIALKDVPATPSLHRPLNLQPRSLLLQGPSENMEPVASLPTQQM